MSKQLVVFSNRATLIDGMPNEDAGALFKALLHYNEDAVLPEGLSQIASIVFNAMKEDVDNNTKLYEAKVEKNRQAGIKSGEVRRERARLLAEHSLNTVEHPLNTVERNELNTKHYTLNPKPKAPNICLEQDSSYDSSNVSNNKYDAELANWMCDTAAVNERRSAELFSGMPF